MEEVRRLAEKLVAKHLKNVELRIGPVYESLWDDGSDTITLGYYSHVTRRISLNEALIRRWPDIRLWEDTILHEIAHAKPFGQNHGLGWKLWCLWLGAAPHVNAMEGWRGDLIDACEVTYKNRYETAGTATSH